MVKFLCQGDRVVDRINNNNPAQQIRHNAIIDRLVLHQLICHTEHTGPAERPRISAVVTALHTGQRKKRRTAETVFLQIIDERLCSCLILCDNILDTASKSSLHRSLIFLFDLYKISHNAVDSGNLVLFFHDTAHTAAIAFITLCNVLQRFQTGLLFVEGRSCLLQLASRDAQLFLPLLPLFLQLTDLLLQTVILCLNCL